MEQQIVEKVVDESTFEWVSTHWAVLSGTATVAAAGIWIMLRKTFATHSNMNLCKADLDAKIKAHEIWEEGKHKELREEVGKVRKDVSELKNILITKLGAM